MRLGATQGAELTVWRRFFRWTWAPAAVLAATFLCPRAAAQLSVEGKEVQIHGFASQGFLYSGGNNYLTTQSSQGSFALTDGGLNLSAQLTPRLRVGAQAYVRDVGQLGNGLVTLDWALADYRFSDWLGIRAGQVKTVQGLYNDTQDLEFLHTWALLPQALYPLDLRGSNISHLGGDIYGSLRTKRLGTLSYTGFAGKSPPDRHGGEQYGLQSYGYFVGPRRGRLIGADLKWNTPLPGLLLGAAYMDGQGVLQGKNINYGGPFRTDTAESVVTVSAQYARGPWRIEWEHRRDVTHTVAATAFSPYGISTVAVPYDLRGWYAATAYRFTKYLEIGSYHSRFYPNADQQIPVAGYYYLPPVARHIYDQAFTARFDIKSHWDLKVEGHFMNGYGDAGTAHGFYPQDNPRGLKPTTNLLVVRLGFNL